MTLIVEFIKAGLPLPRAAKVGKPSLAEFFISTSRVSKNTRTPGNKSTITLQEGRRRNPISTKPPIRMNQRIFPKPTSSSSNTNTTTMSNNPTNEGRNTIIQPRNQPTRLTNPTSTSSSVLLNTNRPKRTQTHNTIPQM